MNLDDQNHEEIISRVNRSPRWSSTTKLVVALSLVALLAGLLVRFRNILGPLLFALALAYLLYPIASFLHTKIHIPWKIASILLLVVLLTVVLGSATLGGIAVVDQVQSLIKFLQVQIDNLPKFIENLSANPITIGFYTIDFSKVELTNVVNQLLGMVQPILTNTANILTSIATGAASTVGWIFFTILVAYFILSESGGTRRRMISIAIPGYMDDINRLSAELSRIWNAFLRGQIIIFTITLLIYIPVLGALGVNYYFGLAILAGLARFVPYIGTWIAWITLGLVTFFQPRTIFGLESIFYTLLIVAVAIVIDFILDNFVVPSLMGNALKIHPAAVMIAAIIFGGLFGLIGVVLAAPVIATLKLSLTYIFKKLFDQDPWQGIELVSEREPSFLAKKIQKRVSQFVGWLRNHYKRKWPDGLPAFRRLKGFIISLLRGRNESPEKPSEPK